MSTMIHLAGNWMTKTQPETHNGVGNILVIEPYESMRESICAWFAQTCPACEVFTSSTVKEALVLLQEHLANIILLSVEHSVPRRLLDARTLLAVSSHARLILLTAFDDEEYRVQAARAGAAGCISKQHLFQELSSLVSSLLQT